MPTLKPGFFNREPDSALAVGLNSVIERPEAPVPQYDDARHQQLAEDGVLIGDSYKDHDADGLLADIHRREWEQFEENDMPYIFDFADQIVGGEFNERAVNQAEAGINNAFNRSEATNMRRTQGLGLELSQRQMKDRNRDQHNARQASLVDAMNSADVAATDRQTAIIAGTPMPESQS